MREDEFEILLVEDDPADAELTTLSLRKEGLVNDIVIARDEAEALEDIFCREEYSGKSMEYPPHLILLDLKLPRVNWHDVLKAIKADDRTKCVPVIVMTSSNHERDLLECYQQGVNSYIQKPLELGKFQETVKQFGIYWLMVNQTPPEAA